MSTKESRRTAREKVAEERRRQAEAEKRRARIINIAIAVAVVVAVTVIFVVVQKSRNSGPSTATLPATVTEQGGGMPVGKDTAPVTVDLWEDFQCPICKDFETVNGTQIRAMTTVGKIKVVYHPLSFLDQKLNNTSSVLAASAFGCSATYGVEQQYHNAIFSHQPATEGTGYTADQLIQWGKDVGITSSDWSTCVNDQRYSDWVAQVEGTMAAHGITGTPTIFLNGKRVSSQEQSTFYTSPAGFRQAVQAAASGG